MYFNRVLALTIVLAVLIYKPAISAVTGAGASLIAGGTHAISPILLPRPIYWRFALVTIGAAELRRRAMAAMDAEVDSGQPVGTLDLMIRATETPEAWGAEVFDYLARAIDSARNIGSRAQLARLLLHKGIYLKLAGDPLPGNAHLYSAMSHFYKLQEVAGLATALVWLRLPNEKLTKTTVMFATKLVGGFSWALRRAFAEGMMEEGIAKRSSLPSVRFAELTRAWHDRDQVDHMLPWLRLVDGYVMLLEMDLSGCEVWEGLANDDNLNSYLRGLALLGQAECGLTEFVLGATMKWSEDIINEAFDSSFDAVVSAERIFHKIGSTGGTLEAELYKVWLATISDEFELVNQELHKARTSAAEFALPRLNAAVEHIVFAGRYLGDNAPMPAEVDAAIARQAAWSMREGTAEQHPDSSPALLALFSEVGVRLGEANQADSHIDSFLRTFDRAREVGDALGVLVSATCLASALESVGLKLRAAYFATIAEQSWADYLSRSSIRERLLRTAMIDYEILRRDGAYLEYAESLINFNDREHFTFSIERLDELKPDLQWVNDKVDEFKAALSQRSMREAADLWPGVILAIEELTINANFRGWYMWETRIDTPLDDGDSGGAGVPGRLKLEGVTGLELRRLTALELLHMLVVLDYEGRILLAALRGETGGVEQAVDDIVSFYLQYANDLQHPRALTVPRLLRSVSSLRVEKELDAKESVEKRMKSISDAGSELTNALADLVKKGQQVLETADLKVGLDASDPMQRGSLAENYRITEKELELEQEDDGSSVGQDKRYRYQMLLRLKKASPFRQVMSMPNTKPGPLINRLAETTELSLPLGRINLTRFLLESVVEHFEQLMIFGESGSRVGGVNDFHRLIGPAQVAFTRSRVDDVVLLNPTLEFSSFSQTLEKRTDLAREMRAMAEMTVELHEALTEVGEDIVPLERLLEVYQQYFTEGVSAESMSYEWFGQLFDQWFRRYTLWQELADHAGIPRYFSGELSSPELIFALLGDDGRLQELLMRPPEREWSSEKLTGRYGEILRAILDQDYHGCIEAAQRKPVPKGASHHRVAKYQLAYVGAICSGRAGDGQGLVVGLKTAIKEVDALWASLALPSYIDALNPIRRLIYGQYAQVLLDGREFETLIRLGDEFKRPRNLGGLGQVARNVSTGSAEHDLRQDILALFTWLTNDQVWVTPDLLATRFAVDIFDGWFGSRDKQSQRGGSSTVAEERKQLVTMLKLLSEVIGVSDPGPRRDALLRERRDVRRIDGTMISYFVAPHGVFIVVEDSTRGMRTHMARIPAQELAEEIAAFRNALQDREYDQRRATRLYNLLLANALGSAKGGRLFVSLDGPLSGLPLHVLRADEDSPYLVVTHDISYLSGLGTPSLTESTYSKPDTGPILVVANPGGDLTAADNEAASIADVVGRDRVRILSGEEAKLGAVLQGISSARHLHFATHARAVPASPSFSYLQLAPGERLYSLELRGLDLGGKSVFLSACETSGAGTISGEDQYGVADALLRAGASFVVATHWRVEDYPTALFAKRYYEYLYGGTSPSSALAETAIDFIDGKIRDKRGGRPVLLDHPFYWGGFSHVIGHH